MKFGNDVLNLRDEKKHSLSPKAIPFRVLRDTFFWGGYDVAYFQSHLQTRAAIVYITQITQTTGTCF